MESGDKTFNPEKYGMVLCPGCKGDGKSFDDTHAVDICRVYKGFGLIMKGEKN